MDYRQTAIDLLDAAGGTGNLTGSDVCLTRLRISVDDMELVDLDRINSMNSVLGVVPRGTSGCDVIFAPSVVDEVYHDFSVASGPLPAIMEDKGGSEGRARMSVTLTPKARATVASSASHEDEDTQALARLLDTL